MSVYIVLYVRGCCGGHLMDASVIGKHVAFIILG